MISKIQRLHIAVSNACPIVGVSVPSVGDSSTVKIDIAAEASEEQRAAAVEALAEFDWSDEADQAYDDLQNPAKKNLCDSRAQSIADNQAYVDAPSIVRAEMAQQIKKLSEQNILILKYLQKLGEK